MEEAVDQQASGEQSGAAGDELEMGGFRHGGGNVKAVLEAFLEGVSDDDSGLGYDGGSRDRTQQERESEAGR